MISGIILDVDGVIVGEKIGYNSPYPHPDVIAKLKAIENKGIPVSLCTAKPHYAIRKIINDADLRSLHITDGGAVIIDPIDDIVLKAHYIPTQVAKRILKAYRDADVYIEAYGLNEYLIEQARQSELTDVHTHILQQPPRMVASLAAAIEHEDICKLMPIAKDEADKARVTAIFEPFESELTLSWGVHPIALPHQFGIITTKGISKRQAVKEIVGNANIAPENILGIGDSTSDWQFIQDCGYAGTVENGYAELKQLIKGKVGKYFIGGHVDGSGILDVFHHFAV
jgi:HAD superfamily hydrolase (TIGR01484 family)